MGVESGTFRTWCDDSCFLGERKQFRGLDSGSVRYATLEHNFRKFRSTLGRRLQSDSEWRFCSESGGRRFLRSWAQLGGDFGELLPEYSL